MPLISLVVLCAVTALLTDRFLSPLNLTNILVQSSIMAVIAMGMTFVIVGGGFDLSVGSTAALSGCVASLVMLQAGIAGGVLAGVLAGALVGVANGLVIAFLNVNPFITDARHHGPRARHRLSDDRWRAGERRERASPAPLTPGSQGLSASLASIIWCGSPPSCLRYCLLCCMPHPMAAGSTPPGEGARRPISRAFRCAVWDRLDLHLVRGAGRNGQA